MEGGVPGAEVRRVQRLGPAGGAGAPADAVQPALGSLRTRPARGRRLRAMVHRARFRDRAGARNRGGALGELPELPATPEARKLLCRASHGEAPESAIQQLAAPCAYGE